MVFFVRVRYYAFEETMLRAPVAASQCQWAADGSFQCNAGAATPTAPVVPPSNTVREAFEDPPAGRQSAASFQSVAQSVDRRLADRKAALNVPRGPLARFG